MTPSQLAGRTGLSYIPHRRESHPRPPAGVVATLPKVTSMRTPSGQVSHPRSVGMGVLGKVGRNPPGVESRILDTMHRSHGAMSPVRHWSAMNYQRKSDSTTRSRVQAHRNPREEVVQFLHARGAADIDHLNGTLFEHLERTEMILRRWGCPEVVSMAGLCHAAYGTDGFPTALIELEERNLLSEVAGPDVEALVYLYASCDRGFVYPRLQRSARMEFRDRFTSQIFLPTEFQLRDFVDLTLGNESDVGLVGPDADEPPGWLMAMFEYFQHLASEPVRRGFQFLISATSQ